MIAAKKAPRLTHKFYLGAKSVLTPTGEDDAGCKIDF